MTTTMPFALILFIQRLRRTKSLLSFQNPLVLAFLYSLTPSRKVTKMSPWSIHICLRSGFMK